MADVIAPEAYAQYLVDQQPKYDKRIIAAIRPTDGWIGHVASGPFPAFSGTSLYLDRFEHVHPNTTRPWTLKGYASCVGTPCNKKENTIGWGSSRVQYFLEEQNWASPLMCFDQQLHVTEAARQTQQIINDILRPATSAIQSMFLRKRALYWAKRKWVANTSFGGAASEFSYKWTNDSDGNEVFLHTTLMPASKLTPQMLQRRVTPLMNLGYFGKTPFQEQIPLIELVSGMETVWELDHLGGQTGFGTGAPSISGNWRFQQWDAANPWYRYGFSGQIGNYAARVDPFEMRFRHEGASAEQGYNHKFRLILPYVNKATTGYDAPSDTTLGTTVAGLRSDENPDYLDAQFRMSFIWHKQAMECLVQDTAKINPELPYASRNFAGKWRAVLPHNIVDQDGNVQPVDNRRGNVVQFIADFLLAIRPFRTEWAEAIFHMAEPPVVYNVTPVGTPYPYPYPTQDYNSANDVCE